MSEICSLTSRNSQYCKYDIRVSHHQQCQFSFLQACLLPRSVLTLLQPNAEIVCRYSYLHSRYFQACCCLATKLCPTLCDPMDCSPPGSSIHGISQARILEWAARLTDSSCISQAQLLPCMWDPSSPSRSGTHVP